MAEFTPIEFKNGQAPYLSKTTLNELQELINNAIKEGTEPIDYTSQVTAINGSFQGGKVYKIGRVVYFQIDYLSTETIGWGDICLLPEALEPVVPTSGNIYIVGANVSIYGQNDTSTSLKIRGQKATETKALVFSYVTKN